MPTPESFDAIVYMAAPIITLGSGITLGRALLDASPKSMPANVKKAAKKLKTTVDAAEDAWVDRQRELGVVSDEDSRALDIFADNLWGALRSRLLAYSALPAADFPKAPHAAELVLTIFGPDGLSFLKAKYPIQLSAMAALLKRIDADGLDKSVNELAGPEFLQAIRKVMPRYDAMVKSMLKRDDSSGQNLLDHTRAIQRAVVEYATKVCATVDEDEPETVELARGALRAIVVLREQATPAKRTAPSAPEAGKPAPQSGEAGNATPPNGAAPN